MFAVQKYGNGCLELDVLEYARGGLGRQHLGIDKVDELLDALLVRLIKNFTKKFTNFSPHINSVTEFEFKLSTGSSTLCLCALLRERSAQEH